MNGVEKSTVILLGTVAPFKIATNREEHKIWCWWLGLSSFKTAQGTYNFRQQTVHLAI